MELFCRNRSTCPWNHSLRILVIAGVLGFWIQRASGQDAIPALVGQKVIIRIPVTGEIMEYTWYRGTTVDVINLILIRRGDQLYYGPGYSGLKYGLPDGSLEVINVQLTDAGNYTRSIEVKDAKPVIATRQLRVYELLPKPTVKMSVSQPIENQSVALTCDNSNFATTILWFFNNSLLQPDNNRTTLSADNKTLTFSRISRYDGGSYRCETENPFSFSRSDLLAVTVSLTGSRISGGAIAGIVVAVVVVLIAVTASSWYFCLKRPASNKSKTTELGSYAPPTPTS